MVRLDRTLGSASRSGGTGSASHWAASAVMSSVCPVRVSTSTLSWQTRSAAPGSASRFAAASVATTASSAMPSAMVWSGRSTRPSLYSRTSSPGASALLASTGGEPVPNGPVPVPSRYLAFPSTPMTSGGGCPQVV